MYYKNILDGLLIKYTTTSPDIVTFMKCIEIDMKFLYVL